MHLAYCHYLCSGDTALLHVDQVTAAARTLGHSVDVYAMNLAPSPTGGSDSTSLRAATRRLLKNRFSRYLHEPKELLWNIRYVGKEVKLLRKSPPEVLVVRNHLLTASCVMVARRLNVPLVLELNEPAAESRLYLDEYAHLPLIPEWLESWKVRNAAMAVVVSSALKQYFIDTHGTDGEKIIVNPNGADVSRFRPDTPPDEQLLAQFEQNTVVGFVGSFQKFHGSELLGRMALRVAEARPSVRFVFVGDGPGAGVVQQMTERLGDRVLLTGRVDHGRVPDLVAGFDVAVLPETAFYCSPLKVIEWMAAGRAVVAPAYGPLEEILESGREGLLFPPGDEDALVESVLTLVDDPEQRQELGSRAAARVRASLTWEDNARRMIGACQRALAEHR